LKIDDTLADVCFRSVFELGEGAETMMALSRYLICLPMVSALACCMPQQSARNGAVPPAAPSAPVKQAAIQTVPAVTAVPAAPAPQVTMIRPEPIQPSQPAVVTTKDLPTYVADLERCRATVATSLGRDDRDNVDAVRRAMKDRPVNGTLTVHFAEGDAPMIRDRAVKKCLRGRGYAVSG
jgi:hypothetical protein